MNLTEAKAKFPIGSTVKVNSTGGLYGAYDVWARKHFSAPDFLEWRTKSEVYLDAGDVGQVAAVDHHGGVYGDTEILVGILVAGKKPFVINADCLEPFDPPFEGAVIPKAEIPQEEPALDTGLTTFQSSSGYKVSFSGTNLIVTAHGETVSHNVEELLDEIQDMCYQKAHEIRVGNAVEIVNSDDFYPCYDKWLKENLTFEQALRFDWENTPKTGDCATVVLVAPHLELLKMLYLIEVEHDGVGRLYLANREAIKKI